MTELCMDNDLESCPTLGQLKGNAVSCNVPQLFQNYFLRCD